MTKRRQISTRDRVAIFSRHDGRCHMCGLPIQPGEAWEVSHEIPLELGGADDDTNRKPAHKKCHREHTAKVDQPMIAKAKRQEARHIGAKVSSSPPLKSAGFRKFEKPPRAGNARIDKGALAPLPRRDIFTGEIIG